MGKQTAPQVITLGREDLLKRLRSVEKELTALAPAPRVALDREATLSMVRLCIQALTAH